MSHRTILLLYLLHIPWNTTRYHALPTVIEVGRMTPAFSRWIGIAVSNMKYRKIPYNTLQYNIVYNTILCNNIQNGSGDDSVETFSRSENRDDSRKVSGSQSVKSSTRGWLGKKAWLSWWFFCIKKNDGNKDSTQDSGGFLEKEEDLKTKKMKKIWLPLSPRLW